ncbi:MAG: polysaccharide biosynthesis protein [Eubacteriales bacterium]|nr:polysaccharide biosynthesis protein [Eubacteriales bacterium]MDD3882703.1 polysaccharide biosynthesis protein [Eubacteriales bacterium]MDD4512676.1 polysaccharide biosynthesis protein [Eubacteriales bacterium]
MTKTQKSIIGGVTILSVMGIIAKLIGIFFRIPLSNIIGGEGIGTYQLVFPTYTLLLQISSAGIPVAVSRLVSEHIARKDPAGALRTFRIASRLLTALGVLSMLIMIFGSSLLSAMVADPETRLGYIAIAPSLWMVCTMSAYRGFLQGRQKMGPTAYSQVIEQLGKVFVALPLAALGASKGIAYGAAGALLGTSIVEGIALLYMMFVKRRSMPEFSRLEQAENTPSEATGKIIKKLVIIAIPITLSACIVPFAGQIDAAMIVNRLLTAGFDLPYSRNLYGLYSGIVIPLINVPTALSIAISLTLVPAISAASARGDRRTLRRNTNTGLRFAFLVGFPCGLGLGMLAQPIIEMLYGAYSFGEQIAAANLLHISAITIVLFTTVQATSSILQGLGRQYIPMYTLIAGVVVKITLNYFLVVNPDINIFGAPLSSVACYTVSMVPNIYFCMKYTKTKFDFIALIVKPILATLIMGAALYGGMKLIGTGTIATILLIILAVVVYLAAIIVTGAMPRSEVHLLPAGRKLEKLMLKLRIYKRAEDESDD